MLQQQCVNSQFIFSTGQYKRFLSFKESQPKLKVSLAVGGWNEGSGKYSNMSATPETRKAFIGSVIAFIRYINAQRQSWK